MRRFNLAIVAIWLAIFGVSTTPTNEIMTDWHDAVVYEVNDTFANHVWVSPSDNKGEVIPLNTSEATQFYLRHTFATLLFFVLALNLAFYAGKGTFGGLRKIITTPVSARWRYCKILWQQRKKDGTPPSSFIEFNS